MTFEPLTLVPLQAKLMVKDMLTTEEVRVISVQFLVFYKKAAFFFLS